MMQATLIQYQQSIVSLDGSLDDIEQAKSSVSEPQSVKHKNESDEEGSESKEEEQFEMDVFFDK